MYDTLWTDALSLTVETKVTDDFIIMFFAIYYWLVCVVTMDTLTVTVGVAFVVDVVVLLVFQVLVVIHVI